MEAPVDAHMVGTSVCGLVSSSLGAHGSLFSATQAVKDELESGEEGDYEVDQGALVNWQEQCVTELNSILDPSSASDGTWDTATLLPALEGTGDGIVFQLETDFVAGRVPAGAGASRRLLARSKARGSAGDGTAASVFTVAKVSEQGWNTSDVELLSQAIRHVTPPVRTLGRNNNLVGGVLLHQVSRTRLSSQSHTLCTESRGLSRDTEDDLLCVQVRGRLSTLEPCSARFASLVTECVDRFAALLAPTFDLTPGVGAEVPFGQDPALNAYSALFHRGGAQLLSEYYNISTGSPELTAVGFPLGFFPSRLHGLPPGFSVLLPVRAHCWPPYPSFCNMAVEHATPGQLCRMVRTRRQPTVCFSTRGTDGSLTHALSF